MKKGDCVKLSPRGLHIFNRPNRNGVKPEDRRGTVLNAGHDAIKPLPDGCVRILWDHYAQPETIAAIFLEVAEEARA